jgi:phage terminase large subunit
LENPQQSEINHYVPGIFSCLGWAGRYKIFHGGRGGAKSWAVARYLLAMGAIEDLRVVCARELQSSMKESVYQLLVDQITAMGLQGFYEIKQNEIRGTIFNTSFTFTGLRGLKGDPTKIKSFEGVDKVWLEEAVDILESTWDILDPTLRKEGSQIIATYNPVLETDFIHKTFVINDPPPGSIVQKVSWRDNDYFPETLRVQMEYMKKTNYDKYLHIWEGECVQMLEGAIYAEEMRNATANGRITSVPYEPTKAVHTFWDLGYSDKTAIWFAQIVGFEYRIIDFYQNRQKGPAHYIKMLQDRGYVYGIDYMPHDADYKQFAAEGRTVADLMREAGRSVQVIQRPTRKSMTHDAVRTLFPNCWFDQKKCADGLQCLRHYRYDVDPDTNQFSKMPLHDENSHAADAFGTLGLFMSEGDKAMEINLGDTIDLSPGASLGWMGR